MSTGRVPGGDQMGGELAGMDRRAVLVVATLSSFLTPLMSAAVNLALPSMAVEFRMDAVLLSWVATAYLMAAAMFLLPFGRLADIIGRKRVFLWGMIVITLVTVALGFSVTGWMVIVLRFVQGIGAAMVFGTGIALLTAVYPKEQRGVVLGFNVAAVYLGLTLGPFIGGALTDFLDWRWVFWIMAPMTLGVVVLVLLRIKGDLAGSEGERFDVYGAVIYSLAITFVLMGFSTLPSSTGVALITAGGLATLLFVVWGTWARDAVMDLNLFWRNRVFAYSNLAALIHYSATFAIGFLMSLYLQYVRGMPPLEASLIILWQPATMVVGSIVAGRWSDVEEPRLVASLGMAITTVGLSAFIFITPETELVVIVGILIIIGMGYALFSSPNTNAVMSSVGPKVYGVASATIGTMRLLGQVFAMGIATVLFAIFIGREEIVPGLHDEFMTALRVAFLIFTVLGVVGVRASMARGNLRA